MAVGDEDRHEGAIGGAHAAARVRVGHGDLRLPGVHPDEFGVLVMDRLYDLVDVCLGVQAELAACPPPTAIRRSRRLVPRPRRQPSAPAPTVTGVGRLVDIARQLHMKPEPPTPTAAS